MSFSLLIKFLILNIKIQNKKKEKKYLKIRKLFNYKYLMIFFISLLFNKHKNYFLLNFFSYL